jgi:hypothetical protein
VWGTVFATVAGLPAITALIAMATFDITALATIAAIPAIYVPTYFISLATFTTYIHCLCYLSCLFHH